MAPGRVAVRHVCVRRRPAEAGPWPARPGAETLVASMQLAPAGVRAWQASPSTEFILHVAGDAPPVVPPIGFTADSHPHTVHDQARAAGTIFPSLHTSVLASRRGRYARLPGQKIELAR
jgi:hypothetical protein